MILFKSGSKILISSLLFGACFLSGCSNTQTESSLLSQNLPSETTQNISENTPKEIPFSLYYQNDPAWADYLCGGSDRMDKYGCGPTAMAMVITNLTDTVVTPPQMADWAVKNGDWSIGGGSAHSLIPDAADAFGLLAESVSIHTPEALLTCLSYDKVLVLLMGPGHFTEKGHFIVVYQANVDKTVRIADPISPERSLISWDLSLLLKELSSAEDSGAPIWAISKKGLNG